MQSVFSRLEIEYYGIIRATGQRIVNQRLYNSLGFTPRSIIIYLLPYYTGEGVNLSKYAVSRDYHILIDEVNSRLEDKLRQISPAASMRGFGDHSPIDEILAAVRAGLGVRGKNHLLLNEKYGSYVFIGEMITDIEFNEDMYVDFGLAECVGCDRCIAACPTGSLSGSGVCLSHLTQKKGELDESEIALITTSGSVWGCDVCQDVCPYNKDPIHTPIPFFGEERIDNLDSATIRDMPDAEFSRRAYAWRGRGPITRNLDLVEKK